MSTEVKETKTQRIERLKREKNAWECLEEIRSYARQGHPSIPPEWLGTYFRFWGVYTQGDGVGAIGGTGGVSYYTPADGQDIKVLSGQVRLSGAMLANPAGQADDMLIAAGQVVITGEVTTVGYRYVIIAGQLAAPEASRDATSSCRLNAVRWWPSVS